MSTFDTSTETTMSTPTLQPAQPAGRTHRSNSDARKVRQASLSVGIAVAVASGIVVFIGSIVLVSIAMKSAVAIQPNYDMLRGPNGNIIIAERPRLGWYSVDALIKTVAIMSIVSLVMSSLTGWFMAHRVVKPLAEALRLQRHFVADASHELRTPLTALSLRVQLLKRHLDAGKPIDGMVDQLQTDAATMKNVLNDMLLIVEGTQVLESKNTPVSDCLNQAVTSLRPLAEQSSISVSVQSPPDLTVAVPEASLTRAVVAIVDNAIAHSPEGSTIEVSAQRDNRTAIIRVTDHGTGITGVDPNQVFERFAHGSETGRKRSFGLGLALASEVAQRFEGNIKVESTSNKGTTFALSFPVA